MQTETKPYISITDFTDQRQVRSMRAILDLEEEASSRDLGVGVMMSYKTLRGLETKWSKAFPPNDAVADIFIREPGIYNVLHYADYSGATAAHDLRDALALGGPHVDAMQLDMIWPSIGMLTEVKRWARQQGRDVQFIIQVNGKAIEELGGDEWKVADKIHSYYRAECADFALFDLSGGTGKPMDAEKLLRFMFASAEFSPDLKAVVAGGLGPGSMELAEPVMPHFPDVSLDAQSNLRPTRNALDPINWAMAADYLRKAARMCAKYEAARLAERYR